MLPRQMSNHRPALLLILACYSPANAQTAELLEAVRVHRAGSADLAKAELQACISAGCADADQLSLLTGYLWLADGEASSAATQLASRPAPKGLEAFHAWYLGEARAWSADRKGAIDAWKLAKAKAPAWLKPRIDARTGELLLDLGQAKKALPLLEAAVAADATPELTYQRGIARWLSGDVAKGQADLRTLLVRWPTHLYAERALAHLQPITFTFDEKVQRSERFVIAGDGKRAVAELDGLKAPPGREGRFALALAAALYANKADEDGSTQLDVAIAGAPGVASEALMMRARKLMKKNDNAGARKVMLELDQKYPDQPAAEDAGYLAAWVAMQAGDFEPAAADFATFEDHHPTSRKRDEARWFRAYSLYRAGKLTEAATTLESLIAEFPKSSLLPQARYWLARSQQKASPKAKVAGAYKTIIAAHPGSFYALLASERLRELKETPPPPFTVEPKALTVAPSKQLDLARALARAGLFKDAGLEVDRVIGTVGSPAAALEMGHGLQAIGEYGPAYSLAARLLWGAVFTQKQPEAIALMYPRAFADSVERLSGERSLDPYLAWAIMRQESAFRPEVTSSADARGLMQLIPPTANSIAKERNAAPPDPAELYAPEANISMGTWLLSALLDRFGHPSLCAAAYNAGAKPVAEWASTRNDLPLDEWVEAIPWKETRGYVKNVTANYFVYRTLYAHDSEPLRLSLTVPAPKPGGVNF